MVEAYYCLFLALNTLTRLSYKSALISVLLSLGLETPIFGRVFNLW